MYANFTNKASHKRIIFILHFVAALFIILSACGIIESFIHYLKNEKKWVLYLPLVFSLASGLCVPYIFWLLRKVSFSKGGIVVKSIWGEKEYDWNSVKEYGVFSVSYTWKDFQTPFFLFIMSDPETVKKCEYLNLSSCFFYSSRVVIPVLYTTERNRMIEGILKQKSKIYDWNRRQWKYELRPDQSFDMPPRGRFSGWQEQDEKKRMKKGKSLWPNE